MRKADPVCVINAALAKRLFSNENPLGKRLQTVTFLNRNYREIGVRMALGASPGNVLAWVLGRAGRMIAWGVAIGLVGAAAFSLLLRSLLYGVAPADPLVLATLAVFLPLVAFASTLAPAWRASRLNPTQALQQE